MFLHFLENKIRLSAPGYDIRIDMVLSLFVVVLIRCIEKMILKLLYLFGGFYCGSVAGVNIFPERHDNTGAF